MPSKFIATTFTALLWALSTQVMATSAYVFPVNILQILSQADDPTSDAPVDFGGCMARLDVNLASYGLNCTTSWVSFSCSGDYASKASASRNFSAAQLALVTKTPALVLINDAKTHNEVICFVERIDNVAEGETPQ